MNSKQEKKCYIAFLDLLGATQKMHNKESSEETLNKILDLYHMTQQKWSQDKIFSSLGEIHISIFSDNICFVREVRKETITEVSNFVSFVGSFQATAINRGLLFRGGITVGNVYIDDTIIWGEGLVRAHKLECEVACYPRIICDFKYKNDALDAWEEYSTIHLDNIRKDFDGMYFIDFIEYVIEKDLFCKHILELCNIEKNAGLAVIKKYEWLRNYVTQKLRNE